jgi:hypothetical protein
MFCFEKHRVDDFPDVGHLEKNTTKKLQLSKKESLVERNYFSLDTEIGYITYHEKLEGFRATTLNKYILKLLKSKSESIKLLQILNNNAYDRLLNCGYIDSMSLSLATPSDEVLYDFGLSTFDRVKYANDKKIDVTIKATLEQDKSIYKQAFDSFVKDFGNSFKRHTESIKVASFKIRKDRSSQSEEINLANDILVSEVNVTLDSGQISENDITDKLNESNNEYKDEIRKLF